MSQSKKVFKKIKSKVINNLKNANDFDRFSEELIEEIEVMKNQLAEITFAKVERYRKVSFVLSIIAILLGISSLFVVSVVYSLFAYLVVSIIGFIVFKLMGFVSGINHIIETKSLADSLHEIIMVTKKLQTDVEEEDKNKENKEDKEN